MTSFRYVPYVASVALAGNPAFGYERQRLHRFCLPDADAYSTVEAGDYLQGGPKKTGPLYIFPNI